MEKQPQSGSEQKIEEYVTRYFDKGESVESHNLSSDFEKSVKGAILDRHEKIKALMEHSKNIEYAKRLVGGENIKLEELPENMRYAIRYLFEEMSKVADTQKKEAIKDFEGLSVDELKELIPQKHRSLPAELIEDFWVEPIRVDDPTHGRAFKERKAYILKYLQKEQHTQSDLNKIEEIKERLKNPYVAQDESLQDIQTPEPELDESKKENSENRLEVELNQKIELDPNLERPSVQEIFGDSNGSYTSFIEHLQSRDLIQVDEKGELLWVGENTRVTFLGDILGDRAPEGEQIYVQLMKLKEQAEKKGGSVSWLAGNHDNMYNSMLFGFTCEKGVNIKDSIENIAGQGFVGNFESAHYLSDEVIEDYFNQEGIVGLVEELLGDTSDVQKIITKRKANYVILQQAKVDPMALESFRVAIDDLERALLDFKNSFIDTSKSSQAKIDTFIALGSYLPNYALVRLGNLILDNRQQILETIKEKKPLLLEGVYEQKLVTIEDDTLCCHTNFTENMLTLIEARIPSGGTFAEGIDNLNKYYQSILRWYGSFEPRTPEKLSDADIKYFNAIRDEFISTSSKSRINYSENNRLDDSGKSAITQRLKGYGINVILHGHNDEDGVVKGSGELPILSVDRSAYKGSQGNSTRPIATASINTKGALSYF